MGGFSPISATPMSNHDNRSSLWIFLAVLAAIGLALAAPAWAVHLKLGGEIFLRLLKMIVVPLVIASVMSGIIGLGDVRRLGRPGGATMVYYLATTFLAVVIGVLLVNLIHPGSGAADLDTLQALAKKGAAAAAGKGTMSIGDILENLALMLFTDNLFRAAIDTQLLPLILFSILFAGMLTTMGPRVLAITDMIVQVNEALLHFVLLLMRVAPLGIFCMVAARFGQAKADGAFGQMLTQTGGYVATVLAGLAVHALVTLPLIFWLMTRRNPYRYMLSMAQALLTAFSTASSSATLPVTIESVVDRGGVSRKSADFVLPLGATINMDGTALYEAVAAIFIAQAISIDLSLVQQLTVVVTAALAAIGAAGIPEAGLVTMVIVLNAVGLPVEYIGLLLAVDWLLDRFRTAVNVWGDAAGAAVVQRWFEEPR